jgi:hypothetical protein
LTGSIKGRPDLRLAQPGENGIALAESS